VDPERLEVALSTIADPVEGADHTTVGGVTVDTVTAGAARVKRLMYPSGWRWSVEMQPLVGTQLCAHAHVGFLAQGAIAIEYADGCRVDYRAPAAVVIEPGHDGWVLGDETAILIQFDCATETVDRLGLEGAHEH
jgi:hypothetical protein